jgi:hypothetical protein
MECHEVCNLFPSMTDAEFRELAADIGERGQIDPIWTCEGRIIDGRHRYRACLDLKIKPKFQEWAGEGGSLLAFVISKNARRRHLNKSQLACIAVDGKRLLEQGIAAELPGKVSKARKKSQAGEVSAKMPNPQRRDARKEAAAAVRVGERYVSYAERIKEQSPGLFEEIKAGRVTISAAMKKLANDQLAKGSTTETTRAELEPPDAEVEQLWEPMAAILEKWPKAKLDVLAKKLIFLGRDVLETSGLGPNGKPFADPRHAELERSVAGADTAKEKREMIRVIVDYIGGEYSEKRLEEVNAAWNRGHTRQKSARKPRWSDDDEDDDDDEDGELQPVDPKNVERFEADMVRLAKEMAAAKDQRKPPVSERTNP